MCNIKTPGGREIVCQEGGSEEGIASKYRDIKPEMDASCMTSILKW